MTSARSEPTPSRQSNVQSARATRLGPHRFLPASSDEPVVLSDRQLEALTLPALIDARGGKILAGYVGRPTLAALRKKGVVARFSYGLTTIGLEIAAALQAEKQAGR